MRLPMVLVLLVSLPLRAQEPSEEETLAWLNYHLAVAEVPGDAMSDLRLKRMLDMDLHQVLPPGAAAPPASEAMQAYRARAQVVSAELAANVDAARDSDPFLLGLDLGCAPKARDTSTCDHRRAQLEAFVPGNAYHGLVVMTQAWAREDAEGFLRAARLAAAAEHYDSVPAVGFASLRERYRQVPPPALPNVDATTREHPAEVMAMGISAATVSPAYQNFLAPCRESAGELREHCRAVARKMTRQDGNLLEAWVGKTVLDAIGTPEDIAMARERQREARWLQAKVTPLLFASERVPVAGLDEYFAVYGSEGEMPAMRALLAVHGIPASPPADWTDASPPAQANK